MMNPNSERIIEIFNQATAIGSAEERARFLDEACRDDPEARAEIESLLQSEEPAREFLRPPAQTEVFQTEKPGDLIGRYKLLQQIGEGGGGVVYMAEQEEPVRRRVALKIIKLGMETREVVARFEAERQALAMMDHPSIARVFDGGATASGRPYFVMELVSGTPITHYCDEQRLTTRQRLELFVQVCQAVQHAHQKGIIHRDLKPSNVLVTELDGRPTPKVIDFGVAKATEQRLTEKTLFTRFGQLVGTPAYMSPEQAGFGGLDIDTRSDVYSLGVLLYELLTGRPPFDSKKLLEAGYEAILKTIREVEPPKPSTKLSTLSREELVATANQRNAEPGKLNGVVRGELDWIVMKALEKDRSRRYETATSFANDIRRHLNNETVVARPPSKLYEFQKTVRRHRFGFAAAAALVLVLTAGVIVSTIEAVRATRAEEREAKHRRRAEENKKKAETVAQLLKGMLEGVSPSVALGRDRTMLEDILKGFADQVRGETNQPEVQSELYETLAYAYHELERYDAMEEMSREALRVNKSLFGDSHGSVAHAMAQLGDALRHQNDLAQAEPLLRDGLTMYLRLVGTNASAVRIMNELGQLYYNQNRPVEAEQVLWRAWEIRNQLPDQDKKDLFSPLHNLLLLLRDQRKYSEAEELLTNGLALVSATYVADHPVTLSFKKILGDIYRSQGRYPEATALLTEVLESSRRILGEEAEGTLTAMNTLALVFLNQGRFEEAKPLFLKLVEVENGKNPESPDALTARNNLGIFYLKQDRFDLAEVEYTNLVAISERVFGASHSRTLGYSTRLAVVFQQQNRLTLAERVLTNALSSARAAPIQDNFLIAQLSGSLASVYLDLGNYAEAESLATQSLDIREKESPASWQILAMRAILGRSLLRQQKYERGEPVLRAACEGLALRSDKIPFEAKAFLAKASRWLEQSYQEANRPEKAAEWRHKFPELDRTEPAKPDRGPAKQ